MKSDRLDDSQDDQLIDDSAVVQSHHVVVYVVEWLILAADGLWDPEHGTINL